MARTPQRTLNQDFIVTNGDAITGDDATGTDGGDLVLEGGDAAAASGGDAGSVVVRPGLPDGAGARGVVNVTNNGGADTVPILQLTSQGTNGEDIRLLVGTQDPAGIVSANPGDVYVRHNGTSSTVLVNSGAADANTTWTDLGGATAAVAGTAGNIYENLVFYMDSSDRNSYTGSGSTVTDLMGNGTSGTLTTGTFEEGAFRFNGASGDLSFTKNASIDDIFSGGGTVIAFFRPNTDGENSEARIVDTSDSADEGWWLAAVGDVAGAQQLRFQRNFTTTTGGTWTLNTLTDPITGSTVRPVLLGPWSCIAVTYDDSSTANDPLFYLNGFTAAFTENTAPAGTAISDAGNELVIGNRTADDRTWDGDVGVILMFDRILSAVEVQEVFNVFAPRYGLGNRGIDSTTLNAQRVVISGGISSGTGGASISDGGDVYIIGGDQTSTSFGRGGDLFIRAGDKTGTGNERGGSVVFRSGSGSQPSQVSLYAGDNTGGGGGLFDSMFVHGTDVSGTNTGTPGGTYIRGGNAVSTGSNRGGGDVSIEGGLGDATAGGDVFVRSGGQTSGNTAGITGDITISTQRTALGGMVATGGTDTDSGDITITTSGAGATAGGTGNISITSGSTAAASGNNPGDITVTAGSFTVANNSAIAGEITLTAGSGTATAGGGGGSVDIVAGNNTNTGTITTGFAGSVTLTAGNMSGTGASAVGGSIALAAGNGAGTNTTGGPVTIDAGDGTGTSAGGAITIVCGPGGATGTGGALTAAGGAGGATSGAGGATTLRGGHATAGASNGGAVTVNGGTATTSGTGGTATLNGGLTGTTGNGGGVSIFGAGGGSTSGNGGQIDISGGDVNSGTAGAVNITAGDSAGASNGAAVTISGGSSSSGTPGAVSLRTTANTASVNVRTQSTFTSTIHEHFTNGQQTVLSAGGTQTNLVTLGSLATNGRNMKLEVYVTGVDNGAGSDHNSQRVIQTYYRTTAGVVTAMTAHLTSFQSSGGGGTFATDVSYNLFISGNDIILRALNASSTTSYTANITIWWNRQEGGFAS